MSESIRVLQVFTHMNRGGAETMIMNYYRNMDRTKVQFDFLVHREHRGDYDDEIEQLGGRIYRMMPISPQTLPAYKKQIADFFEVHHEYRIIHSNMSENGFYIFQEAEKRGIPVRICHAHNAPHGWDLKMFARTYLKHRIRRYTTDLFACGKEAGAWLFGKKSMCKLVLMKNAIDVAQYQYHAETEEKIRQEFGLGDSLVIGHVGRFDPQKNHPFLIDIFNEVQKMHPNAKLLLVGREDAEGKIRRKVNSLGLRDKVVFTGLRSDVNELMQAMDVFVFPSLFEGLPVTIVEAQASGMPIVISDSMPGECVITNNLVTIRSLQETAKDWANHILLRAGTGHTNHYQEIADNGFDIKTQAKWLQDFYLRKTEA